MARIISRIPQACVAVVNISIRQGVAVCGALWKLVAIFRRAFFHSGHERVHSVRGGIGIVLGEAAVEFALYVMD